MSKQFRSFTELSIRLLLLAMAVITATYFYLVPSTWWFSTDDAFYLRSAENLVAHGRYYFNGYPNLFVYPGTSLILAVPIALFGTHFHILNSLVVGLGLAGVWLIYLVFRSPQTRLVAVVTALLLLINELFSSHIWYIRSDHLFVTLSFAALLCWHQFTRLEHSRWLLATVLIAAFAAMVRFQGLFLVAALVTALGLRFLQRPTSRGLAVLVGVALASTAPFILWTLRNYLVYTPETYNMALQFFLGMPGLEGYAGNLHRIEIESQLLYPVIRGFLVWHGIMSSIFPQWILGTSGSPGFFFLSLLLLIAIVAGVRPWLARASDLEIGYFCFSLIYLLVFDVLAPGNDSTVVILIRYWLPVMPFVLFMAVAGWARLVGDACEGISRLDLISPHMLVRLRVVTHGAVALLLVATGVVRLLSYGSSDYREFWRSRQVAAASIADYLERASAPTQVVGSTDWGGTHYLAGRRTISIIDSERISLERLAENQASHLVIMMSMQAGLRPNLLAEAESVPALNPFYATAKSLLARYPEIFKLVFEPVPEDGLNWFAVYSIDQVALKAVLARDIDS